RFDAEHFRKSGLEHVSGTQRREVNGFGWEADHKICSRHVMSEHLSTIETGRARINPGIIAFITEINQRRPEFGQKLSGKTQIKHILPLLFVATADMSGPPGSETPEQGIVHKFFAANLQRQARKPQMGHHAGKCLCFKITDQSFISLLARIQPRIIPSQHSPDDAPGIVVHFKYVSRMIRWKSVYFLLIRVSVKFTSWAFEPRFLRAAMVVHCRNNDIAWVPDKMEHARSFMLQNPFAPREIRMSVKAD